MGLPILDVTMSFRQPQREPEIAIDLEGRHIIRDWSIQPYGEVLVFSSYTRNPDGTVDVTGDYNPQDLAERMSRMGYEVATKGWGNLIGGFDGVVEFSYPNYLKAFRSLRQLNREISLKGRSSL